MLHWQERSLAVNASQKTEMVKMIAEDLAAGDGSGPGPDERAAAARLADLVSLEAVDRMLADADAAGMPVDGPGGLLSQLTKTVLERALGAELDDHLGYVKGDPAGNGSGNSRNGSYDKTVTTTAGPVRIGVPRDRNGSFEPKIVPKGQRRLGQVDDMILSLVCPRHDHPRHPGAPGRGLRRRGQPRADLQRDQRGGRGDHRLADPAAGRGLPDRLHRRPGREGQGRRHGR